MTNSTETFWSVDGQSLQTYAWNIRTLGEDRLAPPPVRGADLRVPYMIGSQYVPRTPDSRVITLGMWVQGSDETGKPPTDEHLKRRFDANWRKLRNLLWKPRRQLTLTKRFWVPTFDLTEAGVDATLLPTEGAWSLYSASAKASFVGGLSPTMQGQAHGVFTVDLLLSDPFFYGDEISIPFSMTEGSGFPGKTRNVVILGDDRTMNIELDFEGPLTSPMVTNETEPQTLFVNYATEVSDGESATIRVMPFNATHYTTGQPYGASGNVRHRGDAYWLYLEPGQCRLKLSAQLGTGVAEARYRPAWV